MLEAVNFLSYFSVHTSLKLTVSVNFTDILIVSPALLKLPLIRYLAPILLAKSDISSGFSLSVKTLRFFAAFLSPPLKSCVRPTARFIWDSSSDTTVMGETASILNSNAFHLLC